MAAYSDIANIYEDLRVYEALLKEKSVKGLWKNATFYINKDAHGGLDPSKPLCVHFSRALG